MDPPGALAGARWPARGPLFCRPPREGASLRARMARAGLLVIVCALLALPATAGAQAPGGGPLNDLTVVLQGLGTPVMPVAVQEPPTPSYDATPAATTCAP